MQQIKIRLFFYAAAIFFIHNAIAEDKQYFVTPETEAYDGEQAAMQGVFGAPIKFTKSGLRCFFKHTFSKSEYTENFLPYNFTHLAEFLDFGKQTQQDVSYAQSTLRLFTNRTKACSTISAKAMEEITGSLSALIEPYFANKTTSFFADAKSSIKKVFYDIFSSKFSFFKEDPDKFLGEVAAEVMSTLQQSNFVQTYVDNEQLKQTLIKFLEVTLNKIIWTPTDQEAVWTNVKQIAKNLENLMQVKIINEDELDDLYQSLLERFIYFLELVGPDLSAQVLEQIQIDVEKNDLLFLTMPEQEKYMQTRLDRLKKILEKLAVKMMANKIL